MRVAEYLCSVFIRLRYAVTELDELPTYNVYFCPFTRSGELMTTLWNANAGVYETTTFPLLSWTVTVVPAGIGTARRIQTVVARG